jgi:hypothetical protein
MSVSLRSRSFAFAKLRIRPSCLKSRLISTSRVARDDEGGNEGEDVTKPQRRQSSVQPEVWLNGEGLQFKDPKDGPNWLGKDVVRKHTSERDIDVTRATAVSNESFIQAASAYHGEHQETNLRCI